MNHLSNIVILFILFFNAQIHKTKKIKNNPIQYLLTSSSTLNLRRGQLFDVIIPGNISVGQWTLKNIIQSQSLPIQTLSNSGEYQANTAGNLNGAGGEFIFHFYANNCQRNGQINFGIQGQSNFATLTININ